MKTTRISAVLAAAALPLFVGVFGNAISACKKDEPPPPLPAATETPPPPPATVNLAPPPEDAADDVGDGDAPKVYGKPADITGLRACCAALAQNAASMPPPQNMYAASAASYCQAAVASVNTPGQKDALIAGIRGAMRGAAVPAACH